VQLESTKGKSGKATLCELARDRRGRRMIVAIMTVGMNILNVPIDLQLIAKGAIIVAAITRSELK